LSDTRGFDPQKKNDRRVTLSLVSQMRRKQTYPAEVPQLESDKSDSLREKKKKFGRLLEG